MVSVNNNLNSNAIITLADSNYFGLLEELINSIQTHEESKNISICILDAGLTAAQINILKPKVYSIKKAKWDIEVPGYKIFKKEWLKSQVSRAFIPNYFPEFKNTFGLIVMHGLIHGQQSIYILKLVIMANLALPKVLVQVTELCQK